MLKRLYTENRQDVLKVARNLFSVFGIRILQRSLGIATVYFMVRAISQHQFGEYQFVLTAAGVLTIFSLYGLDNAVMQSVSRGHMGTYRIAQRTTFLASWLGSLALACFGAWNYSESPEFAQAFWVAALLFPFSLGLVQWKSLIVGQERFTSLVRQESLTTVGVNGLLIAALVTGHTSLPLLVGLYMLVPAVQNTRCTIIAWRLTRGHTDAEPASIRYGLKTSAYMVASVISDQIERLLVFLVLSPATLGLYAAADRLAELVRGATQDFAAVLAPRFAKLTHYPAQMDKLIKMFCLGLGALIIIFAFTLAPWLLRLLFGAEYEGAIPYAQALLCAVAVGNVGQFQFRFVRSQLDADNFRRILLGTSIYRIAAAAILIPLYGLWGVVATIFSYRMVMTLVSTWAVKRYYTPAVQDA